MIIRFGEKERIAYPYSEAVSGDVMMKNMKFF